VARRSGLGKGLSALIPNEVVGDRTSTLREVPIGSIKPNPRQPRINFDEDTMSSLAASIKELGVLQPVLVRQIGGVAADDYELIAGERRWRAARRAGLQSIPVLVHTSDETKSLEQALVENLHRQDLNVLEEAAAYQQLIEEFGYKHDQVAKRVGKSRTAVTNSRPAFNGCYPKARSRPVMPGPCWERPIAPIRRFWPRPRWPTDSPSGPSRIWSATMPMGERAPGMGMVRRRSRKGRTELDPGAGRALVVYLRPESWSWKNCSPPTSTLESRWTFLPNGARWWSSSPPWRTWSGSIN
jgi:ParB/RepB/Spo0J family partition protein